MDIKEIKKIIELMKANELSEFELEEESFRLAIKRKNGMEQQVVVSPAPAAVSLPAPAAPAPTAAAPAAAASPEAEVDSRPTINSPMVGTFYRASSPDADSFINVGDTVDEDTVVCIIEAMKVMNEIKAEIRGVVKKVLVENAQPVEFGQPLFVVEPS